MYILLMYLCKLRIKYTSKAIVDVKENGEIFKKGNLTEAALLLWTLRQKKINN